MSDTKKTLIDEGTEFKGTLTSSSAIVVMGRVEGQMTGPSVEVTETGVLSGKAKVTELRSRGELAGEFDADVIELSGKVRDKTVLRARMVGAAPDMAKAVRDATAGGQARAAMNALNTTPTPAADIASPKAVEDEASGANGKSRRSKKSDSEPQADPSP